LAFSYWLDKPRFLTEGKLAAVLITPSLGVPNWSVIYINTAPQSMIATVVLMEVDVALIALLLPMSTLTIRYARNMAILQVSAGGAMEMTRSQRMMMRRVLILHHMEWIQTGTLIPAPQITSQVN
jgi:hypothetical protein